MATVASQLTRIHDAEGSLTTANLPSGGGGATANTDIFLQGAQSLARRQTNTSDTGGFVLVDAADNDLSATDVHIGIWFWVTHYGILDDLRLICATGTGSPTNYDSHAFPLAEYPALGGWVRAWIDISRAPEVVGGTGLNEAALRSYGIQVSFTGAPGGNAQNVALDAADFTDGTAALDLTGTSGVWSDFVTADVNTTNQYGVFRRIGGVYNCSARVQLGTASSLVFSDSGFVVVFPDQGLVSTTFMGVTCDLQHASTAITMAAGVLTSSNPASASRRPDFVVTGTSGSLDVSTCSFAGMRIVTFTAAVTAQNCVFSNTGQITAPGADLRGSAISGYAGTANSSVLVWDVNTDPDGLLDDTSFTKGTPATHAIEFGTTSPTDLTLRGIAFSGYNAANTQDDSTFHVRRTSGTVTINLVGCSGNTSYRSDGATVVIIVDPVTLTITAQDSTTGDPVQGANVLCIAGSSFLGGTTITITSTGGTATVAHTAHGFTTGDVVRIRGATQPEYNGLRTITVTGVNEYTYAVTGSPASPATGSIVSALVIIDALTDANGEVSDTRSWSSSQAFAGRVRRGSGAPTYKSQPISGTIDNVAGAQVTAPLISDA